MACIFIEDKKNGKDAKFLNVFIKTLFDGNPPQFEIISSGGYTNLSKIKTKLLENSDSGIKNLIIFDADMESNKGGFSKRKKYIEKEMAKIKAGYELFLLPNNKDDGTFETIYENIINPEHKALLECFENYEKCIETLTDSNKNPRYQTPNYKAKMYAYMTAHKLSIKENEAFKNEHDWQFDNKKYWDLDSPYLDPLKDFLKKHIKL